VQPETVGLYLNMRDRDVAGNRRQPDSSAADQTVASATGTLASFGCDCIWRRCEFA
jgi:hypothetical protein